MSKPFAWPIRIYWEDTDAGGIVYYANYMKFMERARTEWLRALGFSQKQLAEETGVLFSVVDMTVRYLKPARLDDMLEVLARADICGGASVAFEQEIRNAAGELLAQGQVRVACVAADSFKPRRLPAELVARIAG